MLRHFGAVLLAAFFLAPSVQAQAPAKVRLDSLGDPLPEGAVARLGTLRMQQRTAPLPRPGGRTGAISVDDAAGISGAFFSPDGKKVFSYGCPALRVWDAATGKSLGLFENSEPKWCGFATLSTDGALLACNVHNGIELWNVNTGNLLAEIKESKVAWRGLAFKDSKEVVSLNHAGDIKWWNIGKKEVVRAWNCLTGFERPRNPDKTLDIERSAFSAEGRILVANLAYSWYEENTTKTLPIGTVAWDTATGKKLWRKVGASAPVHFTFSGDGKWLAYRTSQGDFGICEATTGKELASIAGKMLNLHDQFLMAVSFDGNTVAFAYDGNEVFLWDTTGKNAPRKVPLLIGMEADSGISHLAFSPDGIALLGVAGLHLQIVDLATGKQLLPWRHGEPIYFLKWSADGRSLVSSTRRGVTRFPNDDAATWNIASSIVLSQSGARFLMERFGLLNASVDHAVGVGFDSDKKVAFFLDIAKAEVLGKLPVLPQECPYLWAGRFSPSCRLFVAPLYKGNDRSLVWAIFETKTGKELCQLSPDFPDRGMAVSPIVFAPDESTFAWQDESGIIHIGDTSSGKMLYRLGQLWPGKDTGRSAYAPGGKWIASWNPGTGEISIWNLSTRKEDRRLAGKRFEGGNTATICWSPDGRMLADTCIADQKTIRIWEVATGKLRRQLVGHTGFVSSLAFSPDSRYLASGSADTTVLIWDLGAH